MSTLISLLSGQKTHLMALAGAVTVFAWGMGLLDEKTALTLLGLEGFGTVSTIRAAMAKMEK